MNVFTVLEYWLFSLLVGNNLVSVEAMDKWITRINRKRGPFAKATIYVNPDVWDAQIKHPDIKRVNTIEQVCACLDESPDKDLVYMGAIDGVATRCLTVTGARMIMEGRCQGM